MTPANTVATQGDTKIVKTFPKSRSVGTILIKKKVLD